MPEVICTTVYRIDELSDAAKSKAKTWYRELGPQDDWWNAVYDDFERVCDILGVSLRAKPVRLLGGGTRQKPCIWFSGFWSQGDGACFEAGVRYGKGSVAEIKAYAPQDAELHRIAIAMQDLQRRNFYQITGNATHRGRYYHEYCMDIAVDRDSPTGQSLTDDAEAGVTEALRDLARWLYRQLQAEHDHLTSDEVVEESIANNEYTFTEAGRRFG